MKSSNTMKFWGVICLLVSAAFFCGCQEYDDPAVPLDFSADHSFHFNGTEWVYFSGVIETGEGNKLGIMFTIFQFEKSSISRKLLFRNEPPDMLSNGNFAYPCILAISDPEAAAYYSGVSLGLKGTAGTKEGLPVVTSGDSQFTFSESGDILIRSDMGSLAMNLSLETTKDVLLHGEDGIISMGDGIDSGYYSFTNLVPSGTLTINDREYTVTSGRIWMDHQWGNWTLDGMMWDWFSMRFDNGAAMMLFQFRDGNDNVVGGNWTYRDSDGDLFYGTDFSVDAHRTYDVDEAIASYPVDWDVTIPSLDAEFEVKPLFDEQIVNAGLWEGLCAVDGEIGDSQLSGDAFVELTGYSATVGPGADSSAHDGSSAHEK